MGPGMVAYLTHRFDQATPLLKAASEANPRFYFHYIWLGLSLAHQGDTTAAIAAANEAVRLAPGNGLMEVMRGQVLALAHRTAEARAIARKATEDARTRPVASFELARLYAFLNDTTDTFRWIERSVSERETQAVQLLTPGFEFLRDDPHYRELLQQMHLALPPR